MIQIGTFTRATALAVLVLAGTAATASAQSIVGVASKAGTFGTLLTAAKAAGLAGTLDKGGPFTVFAPTDAAFAALPAGTVESLLKPKNKAKLAAILKYHVVGKVIAAKDVPTKRTHVKTLNGASVAAKRSNGGVTINAATVTTADIKADNGIIHVIDKVLLPPKH
jgi:uncharacterized surface protein with fasciclin (FAS1) repeats